MEKLLINFLVGIIISGIFFQSAEAKLSQKNLDAEQKIYKCQNLCRHFHHRVEKNIPYSEASDIKLYFIDGFNYKKPAAYARTSAVQALIKEIEKSQYSIDFAVFGFSAQPELLNALINAEKRGVIVRWVFDVTPDNKNYYGGTFYTASHLKNYSNDLENEDKTSLIMKEHGIDYYSGTLMHNKYFIIDKKIVWTGSTNISSTGSGGYNTNVSAIIKSKELADIYTEDFEKMYLNKEFHQDKKPLDKKNIKLNDNSFISAFFSPNIKIIDDGILPIIQNAHKYIYVPAFYLTSEPIIDSLANAKKRGVDVEIIADAHYASTKFSKVNDLREKGVLVKVENWGGKMHMKSLIADDKYIILGSCNFTSTGIKRNDENLVIIENSILANAFRKKFEYYWNIIPDKWLYQNPKPEGEDSIGSCSDGIDNDHDGLIDKKDPDCQM